MRIRTKRLATTFAGLVMLGVLAHTATSQDKKDAKSAGGPGEAAAMAAMMKAGTPGEQHKMLAKMAGTFDAVVSFKMSPDGSELTSKGRETSEMLFDGRYLKSEFSADMMGMPFKGTGLTGYDNTKKKFVVVWLDSMSTGMMVAEGDADAAGKVITFGGEYACPVETGTMRKFRQVWTIKDNDHHEFEMFSPGPDGKEFRGMHIKYTRVK